MVDSVIYVDEYSANQVAAFSLICIISVINDLSNEENRNTTLLNLRVTGFDKAPWNVYKYSAGFTA